MLVLLLAEDEHVKIAIATAYYIPSHLRYSDIPSTV